MRAHPHILWEQGLLLQPQHFQLHDLVQQHLLDPVYRYALPHFWGVAELALDEPALAQGTVLLRRGSFLFRDGTFAVLGENAVMEGRLLRDAWQGETQLTVYLGLKRWNDSGANVAVVEGSLASLSSRLVAGEPEELCDLHAGGPAVYLRCQSYLLKLFVEGELPQLGPYLLIPLVRLERRGEGASLVESFIPPVLSVAAAPFLGRMVRELSARVCTVGKKLHAAAAQKAALTTPLSSRETSLLLTLRSLNRFQVALDHLLEEEAHPGRLFLALCQLIADLAAFSERLSLPGGEDREGGALRYCHHDLTGSFSRACTLAAELLDEIAAHPGRVIPLVREDGLFAGDLSSSRASLCSGDYRSVLSFCSEADPGVMLRALHGAVKVTSPDHLRILSTRSLPGIGLTHMPALPYGVPQRPHTLYAELDRHHEQWKMVLKEERLVVYWDDAPADLEIELLIVPRVT